jgi:hypothetical protein
MNFKDEDLKMEFKNSVKNSMRMELKEKIENECTGCRKDKIKKDICINERIDLIMKNYSGGYKCNFCKTCDLCKLKKEKTEILENKFNNIRKLEEKYSHLRPINFNLKEFLINCFMDIAKNKNEKEMIERYYEFLDLELYFTDKQKGIDNSEKLISEMIIDKLIE